MGRPTKWTEQVAAESLADLASMPEVLHIERNRAQPRLMVVDDDDGFRTMLRLWLADEDVRVVAEAADGEKAVELAAEASPDLIIMDLRMPRMGGLEAARRIKETLPDAQVIMLSAYSDTSLRYAAEDVGVYSYLAKGCSPEVLWETIRYAWAYKQELQGDRQHDWTLQALN
jgi:DNA-binding NarL/FixJ family response regulator